MTLAYFIRHPATELPDLLKLPLPYTTPVGEIEDNLQLSPEGYLQMGLLKHYFSQWAHDLQRDVSITSIDIRTSPLKRARVLAEEIERVIYPILKDHYYGINVVESLREINPHVSLGELQSLMREYGRDASHHFYLNQGIKIFEPCTEETGTILQEILHSSHCTFVFGHARRIALMLWILQHPHSKINAENLPSLIELLYQLPFTSISKIRGQSIEYIGQTPHLKNHPEFIGGHSKYEILRKSIKNS